MFSAAETAAMGIALEEALKGGKRVFPNPMVGAVILTPSGEVVSKGHHQCCGAPHAEIMALERADSSRGNTLVVTLEPCCHHGRTPPCAEAIVEAGISRVVVAMEDPDPRVSGGGIEYLRKHGLDVETGLMSHRARELNTVYLHHRSTGRSFLHLKMAGTLDGRSAASDGSSRWITGPAARERVHRYRKEAHAVLVGAGTVCTDDPRLSVRAVECSRQDQPVRIVFGERELPADLRIFTGGTRTIVAGMDPSGVPAGIEVWNGIGSLERLLERTAAEDLGLVLCEGGATLAASLLRSRVVDRISVFTAPALLGCSAVPLLGDLETASIDDILRLKDVTVESIDGDILTEGNLVYRTD